MAFYEENKEKKGQGFSKREILLGYIIALCGLFFLFLLVNLVIPLLPQLRSPTIALLTAFAFFLSIGGSYLLGLVLGMAAGHFFPININPEREWIFPAIAVVIMLSWITAVFSVIFYNGPLDLFQIILGNVVAFTSAGISIGISLF